MMKKIILAVPKGRILEELEPLLKKIAIIPEEEFFNEKTRKLTFSTNFSNLEIIKIRSFDVASFVRFGGADIGICGKDVIEEFSSSEFYSILDLKIGKCRLALAKQKDCQKIDIIGSAGTMFFADTRQKHMGHKPRNKARGMAWARWSLDPNPKTYKIDHLQPVSKHLISEKYPKDEKIQNIIRKVVC